MNENPLFAQSKSTKSKEQSVVTFRLAVHLRIEKGIGKQYIIQVKFTILLGPV